MKIGRKLLAEALGSTSGDFVDGLIVQLINATSPGQQLSESNLNFALSVIKNVKPNDQVEAMLAAQMVVVHMATMRLARQLAHVDNLPQLDSNERAFNKLARTYSAQMQALKTQWQQIDSSSRLQFPMRRDQLINGRAAMNIKISASRQIAPVGSRIFYSRPTSR